MTVAHDPSTCDWWDQPAPPLWDPELRCPVEACAYETTESEGCGLAKFVPIEQALAEWDAGNPVVRSCLAHRRGDEIERHWDCQPRTKKGPADE